MVTKNHTEKIDHHTSPISIPSQQLKKHNFSKNVEAVIVEINLRKNKLLLVGTYHSTSKEHGSTDSVFFEQMGFALDVYSSYDKFLIAGDLNVEEGQECLDDFMDEFHAKKHGKRAYMF